MAIRKMQNVSFRSIGEFLDYLPPDELKITERLRKIVFDCLPDVTEKLSYNVPFYRRHAAVCFIWPGSVSWGNVRHKGVRFGFNYGHLLQDDIQYLDKGSRKQVYYRDFFSPGEINPEILKAYIFEAALIDEQKATGNKKRRSR